MQKHYLLVGEPSTTKAWQQSLSGNGSSFHAEPSMILAIQYLTRLRQTGAPEWQHTHIMVEPEVSVFVPKGGGEPFPGAYEIAELFRQKRMQTKPAPPGSDFIAYVREQKLLAPGTNGELGIYQSGNPARTAYRG